MALYEEMKHQGNLLFRYRGTLPVIFLVVGIIVFILHRIDPGEPVIGGTYDYICLAVGILGLLIRIYTVGHSAKKTSGRNTREQVAGEVNSTGIYSIVRHPLYVGNFFMWLGVAMLTAHVWFIIAFVLLYWVYYERIMFAEEEFLRGKFGDVYVTWASKTPAFIPGFGNYKKPKYPFNYKKVLNKEKNGLLALLVIFFLFNLIGDYMDNKSLEFNDRFWYIAAIVGVLYYLVIKLLIKTTKVLSDY